MRIIRAPPCTQSIRVPAQIQVNRRIVCGRIREMVGAAGLEPTTPSPQMKGIWTLHAITASWSSGGSPRKPELKFTSQSGPPIPISQPTSEKLKGNDVIMLRRISAIWSGLIAAVFYAFGSRILFPDQMSPLVILATSSIIGALVFYRVLTWRRGD